MLQRKEEVGSSSGWPVYAWGNNRSMAIARRLNERCLQWLARIAATEEGLSLDMFRRNRDLWLKFDARACNRAAQTPIILLNCNFQRVDWWTDVLDRSRSPIRRCARFGPDDEEASRVLREILTEARTIALSDPFAANLVFGAPSEALAILASFTLTDIDEVAARQGSDLRPRWEGRVNYWRNLLLVATAGRDSEMSEFYCYSLQLLGSEYLG